MVPKIVADCYGSAQRLYYNYGVNYSQVQADAKIVIGTALRVVLAAGIVFTAARFSLIASIAIGSCSIPASLIALAVLAARQTLTHLFRTVSLDNLQTAGAYAVTVWTMLYFADPEKKVPFLNYLEKPIDDLTSLLASWMASFYKTSSP